MCSIDVVIRPIAIATLVAIDDRLHNQRGLSDGLLCFSIPTIMLQAAFPARFMKFTQSRRTARNIYSVRLKYLIFSISLALEITYCSRNCSWLIIQDSERQ